MESPALEPGFFVFSIPPRTGMLTARFRPHLALTGFGRRRWQL